MIVEYHNCPLCRSEAITTARVADCTRHKIYSEGLPKTLIWMECTTCGHSFTRNYFDAEGFALLMSKTNPQQIVGGLQVETQREISARIVDRVSQVGPQSGRWLDVGFGNGSLLMTAAEYGFEPHGIDLRAESVQQMRARGVEAECIDITQLKADKPFDVISMMDVLEHMPYPKQALHRARALLKNGLLVVCCPAYDCMAWREADAAGVNPYWIEIEHFHNFSRSRMVSLLKETGFRPLKYTVSQRWRLGMEIIARA